MCLSMVVCLIMYNKNNPDLTSITLLVTVLTTSCSLRGSR